MEGRNHLIIGSTFFIILWIIIPSIHISEIIIAIFLSICSDIDLKFKKRMGHRSIWTHSIILPFIVFLFLPFTLTILFISSFGLHCSCDLKFRKVGGTYTIKIIKIFGKTIGLNYEQSTIWLLLNFLFSFALLLAWCIA
jgi:hypothetical protein